MAFFRSWRLPRNNRKLLSRRNLSLQGLRDAPVGRNTSSSNWSALATCRCLHSSPALRGLEEFFPKGDVIEEGESAGKFIQQLQICNSIVVRLPLVVCEVFFLCRKTVGG